MARSNGGILADFQAFLAQGNVVDLAVAVIIGGAFGKIISSLVEDIITPAILTPALKAAKVDDLKNLSWDGIKYGSFLAAVINFFVIAFCIFILIRMFEKAKKRMSRQEAIAAEVAAAADPTIVSQERLITAVERLTSTIESRGT
jgi:large conductance mechanosensitive channel